MIKQLSWRPSLFAGMLAASAGSAAAQTTTCSGTLAPGSYANVSVPAHATCTVSSGTVNVTGDVTVGTGAALAVNAGTLDVTGNVTVGTGATLFVLTPAKFIVNSSVRGVGTQAFTIDVAPGAASILGSLTLTGTTGSVAHAIDIRNVFVGGSFSIANSNTPGSIDLIGNDVAGNLLLRNNTCGFANCNVVSANTVGGSLVCSGNITAPVDLGTANVVGGNKVGQCSTL